MKVARRLELEGEADLLRHSAHKPVELKVKMPMLPYEQRKRNFKIIEMG
jgi:formate dehydrogenase major subunit